MEHIPDGFLRGDVHVDGQRHLIFATNKQLKVSFFFCIVLYNYIKSTSNRYLHQVKMMQLYASVIAVTPIMLAVRS